ncbi:MAG TPA: hypothetical protein DCP97_05160 [Ruminococcaceae bacterium]|nr:hypothetical protein [Oscillospiraceae bacterium]
MKALKLTCIMLAIPLFLTGCWNYREIETMSIVSGMAIDKGRSGYKYHITYQYADITGNADQGIKPALVESDGDTLFDATRNAISQVEKKLFFSDCKIVVISKDLAQEGIVPLLDWFLRDAETRITVECIVSDEEKASDLLKQEPNTEKISAFTINRIIDNSVKHLGKFPDMALYKVNSVLNGKGISLVLPLMAMRDSATPKAPEIIGTAVFKGDKMIGSLDDMDSRYLMYIKNQLKGGLIIANINSKENNTTLEISKSKTKCTPSVDMATGKASIKLKVETEANIAEENSEGTNISDLGIEAVQDYVAQNVKTGIINLIKKVQSEYKSDIFGFGSCIYKNEPEYWKKYGEQWDKIFPTVEVEADVKIKINNTAVANLRKKEE